MSDVAPEILSAVRGEMADRMASSRKLRGISNRIRDGTARMVEAHDYAETLGDLLSDSYAAVIRPGVLPGDRMYYNIGSRVVAPTMQDNFRLVDEASAAIAKTAYQEAGLGLNPVNGTYPVERVNGLIDKLSEAETLEHVLRWLDEPIVNTTISFYDDFVKANADFLEGAGIRPHFQRELGSAEIRRSRKRTYFVPCEWCQNLAGEYEGGDLPDDFYRRHEGCRCKITYQAGRVFQSATTRRWYTVDGAAIEAAEAERIAAEAERRAALIAQALAMR